MVGDGTFADVPIDAVRAYWDARPCNIRHSSKPVGERGYFDEVEAKKYFVEPHIPGFAEFERWRGRRVLEIGCGIGTDTINFARHGAQVTAVDISEKSLEIARRRAEVFGLTDQIEFVLADSENLSDALTTTDYDLIYSFGVLHHTPHPDRALAELHRYLKPGGALKLMVYHRASWKVLWILLKYGYGKFWRLAEIVAARSEAETGCPVTYTYSRAEACAWVERHGFEVTRVSVDHIFPYRIPDYVQHRCVRVWYFRLLPKPLFRWLERRFGWHLMIDAVAH